MASHPAWRRVRDVALVSIAVALILGCGDEVTITPPEDADPNGTVTAVVDGVAWNLYIWDNVWHPPKNTSFRFTATDRMLLPTRIIVVGATDPDTTGAPIACGIQLGCNAEVNWDWSTNNAFGGGTLTITNWTATGASGTFSFAAGPNPGTKASGVKQVTGSFTITSWEFCTPHC